MKKSTSAVIFIILLSAISTSDCKKSVEPGPEPVSETGLPSRFDWRDREIMTPVKDQGMLGSCGVFAGTAVFEALIK